MVRHADYAGAFEAAVACEVGEVFCGGKVAAFGVEDGSFVAKP